MLIIYNISRRADIVLRKDIERWAMKIFWVKFPIYCAFLARGLSQVTQAMATTLNMIVGFHVAYEVAETHYRIKVQYQGMWLY